MPEFDFMRALAQQQSGTPMPVPQPAPPSPLGVNSNPMLSFLQGMGQPTGPVASPGPQPGPAPASPTPMANSGPMAPNEMLARVLER